MKIATFNTNSIRARLPIILDWLKNESPDVLCIQETKVQDKDFPLDVFQKQEYHAAFRGQKSYNGVAVLSRLPLENTRTELFDQGDEQARFISGTLNGISVINVYVPQGFKVGSDKFQYKLEWLDGLIQHINQTYSPEDSLLLAGDFNVALSDEDVYDPDGMRGGVGFHLNEQERMAALMEWGLVDIFRKHVPEGTGYTFWDYRIPNGFKRNMGWRIDYLLATVPLAEKCQRISVDTHARGIEKPSDHTFLTAVFDV